MKFRSMRFVTMHLAREHIGVVRFLSQYTNIKIEIFMKNMNSLLHRYMPLNKGLTQASVIATTMTAFTASAFAQIPAVSIKDLKEPNANEQVAPQKDDTATKQASDESVQRVQEIVVTGARQRVIDRENRTSSGLLDVPLQEKPRSVQLIDERTLRDQITTNEEDLVKNIPGAQFAPFGRGQGIRINLRGVNAGFAVDGISARENSAKFAPELYESVEVQRGVNALEHGSTGFGFGGGAGGTVNFLRKYPERQRATEIFANVDQWGAWRTGVDVRQPIGTSGSGVRAVATLGKNDTYFRGEPALDYQVLGLSGTWRATNDLIIDAFYDFTKDRRIQSYFISEASGEPTVLPRLDRRQSLSAPWSASNDRNENFNVKTTYLFSDNWSAELNTRLARAKFLESGFTYFFGGNLVTGEVDNVAFFATKPGDSRGTNIDFRIKGEHETGVLKHMITAGVSAYRDRSFDPGGGYFGSIGPNNIFNWITPVRRQPESLGEPSEPGLVRQREDGYFVQARTSLNNRYDIWYGLRHAKYETNISGGSTSSDVQRDKFTTPSLALSYRPSVTQTFYASYAESIAPGFIVSRFYANEGEIFSPQRVKQRELGWKWDSKQTNLTLALFGLEQPNVVEIEALEPDGLPREAVSGLSKFRGFEATAVYRIGKLDVSSGFVLLDAKVKNPNDPEIDGTRTVGVTRRFGNIGLNYRDVFIPGLRIGVNARAQGKTTAQTLNFKTPGYVAADMNVGYETKISGSTVNFRLAIENVGDTYYWENTGYEFTPGAPRTFRFEISTKF